MIKRTIFIGNPAYLSLKDSQLVIKKPSNEGAAKEEIKSIPIEDLGVLVIEHMQVTITSGAISALLDNNSLIITCDAKCMPTGLLLPLCGNSIQNERFRNQLEASLPLKKQLWQQTIEQKVLNQAVALKYVTGKEAKNMIAWSKSVKSGDSENIEGRAAAYYWKNIFEGIPEFTRGQYDEAPNNLLNYGYAILRAVVARGLVAAGLLPTLGIHHHNRYNAYCLADDIMEPYRPYVDILVTEILKEEGELQPQLTKSIKARLLTIPTLDVVINGRRSPLMLAVSQTAASLNKCFSGEVRKLVYPELS